MDLNCCHALPPECIVDAYTNLRHNPHEQVYVTLDQGAFCPDVVYRQYTKAFILEDDGTADEGF
jgi:hypothetical protein